MPTIICFKRLKVHFTSSKFGVALESVTQLSKLAINLHICLLQQYQRTSFTMVRHIFAINSHENNIVFTWVRDQILTNVKRYIHIDVILKGLNCKFNFYSF